MLSSPIEEIKNRLDIVEVIQSYIKLQKAGANYRAVCPFHSEKKPSFFVSPARQIWHCFGACGEGGDIFKFVMKIEGVEFGDALRTLAQRAGVELVKQDPKLKTERQRLYEISELASRFFEKQLEGTSAGEEAKKYLLNRGVKGETIKNWRVGYAPDVWQGLSDFLVGRGYKREELEKAGLVLKSEKSGNYYDRFRGRIIFPVFDLSSQVVGFGGRVFKQTVRPDSQEEAKYINTPATLLYDKSRVLYGLNKAGIEIRKRNACVLVEGYVDAILADQAGFENVVATSGTALTSFQLKILKRYSDNLLTAFDMDIAGGSATKRGIDLAQALGFNVKVITMPKDSDPADIISQNSQEWENLVKNPKTIHDFYFETTLSRFDKNTLEGKKEISKVLLPVIKRIPNKIEQTFWVQSLAKTLEVKEEDILEELEKIVLSQDELNKTEEISQNIEEVRKSRKELLEERLIVLAVNLPKNLKLIAEEDLNLFSPQASQAFRHFKEKGTASEIDFPAEQKEFLEPLLLKAEAELPLAESAEERVALPFETPGDNDIEKQKKYVEAENEKEFRNCLKEIKTLGIKSELDEISKKIKEAEDNKDFEKVQELTRKFNNYSKSWCDLETA